MRPAPSTPEEIHEALQSGRAERRLIVDTDSWTYTRLPTTPRAFLQEWWMGVDLRTPEGHSDGCVGEWVVEWWDFHGKRGEDWAPRLAVFGEALSALDASRFMEHLPVAGGTFGPGAFRALLLAQGWVDRTQREAPPGITPLRGI